jgi:hypothetical protein
MLASPSPSPTATSITLLAPKLAAAVPPLQSEYGDIYKATLVYEGETVSELRVKYFDTLPPCTSLAVLKTGFLFTASETGNHALYQFVVRGAGRCRQAVLPACGSRIVDIGSRQLLSSQRRSCSAGVLSASSPCCQALGGCLQAQFPASCIVLCARLMHCLPSLPTTAALQGTGEDEDDVEASSASLVQSEEGYAPVFFSPRPLKNLVLVDEVPSLMPLTGEAVGCWGVGPGQGSM